VFLLKKTSRFVSHGLNATLWGHAGNIFRRLFLSLFFWEEAGLPRHPCCKPLLALVEPLIKTDEHRHVRTELLSCWMSSVFIHIHVQTSRVHVCVTPNQRYLQNATIVFLITVLGTRTTAERQSSWDGKNNIWDSSKQSVQTRMDARSWMFHTG